MRERPRPRWYEDMATPDPDFPATLPEDPHDWKATTLWCWEMGVTKTNHLVFGHGYLPVRPTLEELSEAVHAGVMAYHLDSMSRETRWSLTHDLTMTGRTLMADARERYGLGGEQHLPPSRRRR